MSGFLDPRIWADTALEISIVGSFSVIGDRARRWMFGWSDPAPDAMTGKTALVTGATSGLGRTTTDGLVRAGARVVLLGRTEEKLIRVRDELREQTGEDRFAYVVADMSDLSRVREAVAQVIASETRLDVIIDNAGAIFEERTVTDEGLEKTFATMVAGPFTLIGGLRSMLEQSRGRAISVVSGGMYAQALPLDDLQYERGDYNGTLAYARAKRASTALIREWARRHGSAGVRYNAMHPGWADTPGLEASLPGFYRFMGPLLRTPEEGVDTAVWLAADPDAGVPGGKLYLDRRPRPYDRVPSTRVTAAERRELWDKLTELTNAD